MSCPSRSSGSLGTDARGPRVIPVVFLVSAAVLADEIVLIRLLSIRFWPHFVPLIISQALLGAGGSGIALHFLRGRFARNPGGAFAWMVLAAAPSYDLAYRVSRFVPFDPFLLLWRPSAWPAFALFFLLLSIPFFLAGVAVAIPFSFGLGRPGPVYAASFAGSAAGALMALPAFFLVPTESLLRVPLSLGIAASALVLGEIEKPIHAGRAAAAVSSLLLLFLPAPEFRASQYKDLELFRKLPGAKILAVRHGPGGDYRALFSPAIHSAPGLSFRFVGDIPPQAAVFADGELRGIVPREGGKDPPAYLGYFPAALAYRLAARPAVLQLGLRGTEGVLAAARGGASKVTIVEPSTELVKLVGSDLRAFSGGWPRDVGVEIRTEGLRSFLARERRRFDIIEVADISSATFSSLGIHAAGETFLLTREGVRAILSRLSGRGMLVFSGWLKVPPRESVKILRTVRAELERAGFTPAADKVLLVRGWGTFSAVARPRPFDVEEIAIADRFCRETGFSLVWPPHSARAATGDGLEDRAFRDSVRSALAGPADDPDKGLFDLRPVTDDSPYFHRFLKFRSLPEVRRLLGDQWIPFVEWGVVFLLLSLAVSAAVAAACLLLPVFAVRSEEERIGLPVVVYFSALGLAYMFLELMFLKAGILVLGDAVRAAVSAIGGFTFFSGLGSAWSGRWEGAGGIPGWVFTGIAAAALAGFLGMTLFPDPLLAWGEVARIAAFVAFLAPAAFLMGIPFPSALERLYRKDPGTIPFAWAVNGFFSVAGSSLASVGALWIGFRGTVLLGALLYLLAGALYPRLGSPAGGGR